MADEGRVGQAQRMKPALSMWPSGTRHESVLLVAYPRGGRRAIYRLTGPASGSDGRAVSGPAPVGRALMDRRGADVASGGRIEQLQLLAITAALAEAP